MNVLVEPATASDADAIRTLEGLPPVSGRLLDRDLAAADRCCLVARVDPSDAPAPPDAPAPAAAAVVGYVAAAFHLDEAEVLDVVVAPPWRRRGIARTLIAELARRMRERGVSALTLEVREGRLGTQALYRDLGFVVEGRRPGYYADGEAALIMWRRT